MSHRTETLTLPAYLASALINGDRSGLGPIELIEYMEALELAMNVGGSFVGCSDEPFIQRGCDLPGPSLLTECLEFTLLIPEES